MPPPVEVCDLWGYAVLWPFLGRLPNGEVIVTNPVEIRVRWTWGTRSMLNSEGETVATDAQAVVALEVAENSILWEGREQDLQGTGTGSLAADPDDLMRVNAVSHSPDLRYDPRNVRRTIGMQYYRKRLTLALPEDL